jgi:glycosyltransferase involved in cell wall biosynthesis
MALLGRRDEPTDALEDYCGRLAQALKRRGFSLEICRVPWAEAGWLVGLKEANKRFGHLRGRWALVQYTALAWSRRGFPLWFAWVVDRLKRSGALVLIVFHDPEPFRGSRWRDRLRRRVQLAVMTRAARRADSIVSTIPVDRVQWMQDAAVLPKTLSVPVGSNLPVGLRETRVSRVPIVIVFGFSNIASEAAMIASVLSAASKEIGSLHLVVFGRGARIAGKLLRPLLDGGQVEVEEFGIVEPGRASSLLANADVQLFIRSGLSSRRGSGIAGIVNGVPIVGYFDEETAFPITEAGVRLVPVGDQQGLVRELILILKDRALHEALRERNLKAASQHFSWDRIADRYLSVLRTH